MSSKPLHHSYGLGFGLQHWANVGVKKKNAKETKANDHDSDSLQNDSKNSDDNKLNNSNPKDDQKRR